MAAAFRHRFVGALRGGFTVRHVMKNQRIDRSSFRLPRAARLLHRLLLIGLLTAAPAWSPAAPPAAAVAEPPTLVLPDGGRYFGPLEAGLLHGDGRIEWGGGSLYHGEFVHGRMQGHGKRTGPGYVYEGGFVDGAMQGRGKLVRDDGTEYEGEFVRNNLEGQGTLKFNGGFVYQGTFKKDKPAGKGRMTYPNGIVIEGTFEGYQPVGPAVLIAPQGVRYEGELQNQAPHGKGAITLEDKSVLSGEFEYGELDGPAQIRYPDGSVYKGAAQRNRAHGRGEMRYANGDVYRGQFVAGKPDGKGRLVKAAARGKPAATQEGYWRKGDYVGTEGDGTVEESPGLAASNNEAALYNQQALLQKQFDALKPSGSAGGGPARMYALLVAGDGSQEVFRREVAFVDDLFARRYDTRGRSVSLVNSRSSVAQLPLATTHSIEQSLKALAKAMDRERDLLFVFLSSHGSRKHELSLGMSDMALPDLPAARLGAMLKASGIRNQVVVVSACYSGGFIPVLQGERTWVITAARADRTSFGCADENDFTYFGRALFKESLPNASSLTGAVGNAIKKVEEWEARDIAAAKSADAAADPKADAKADAAMHSEPQSVVASKFRAEVDNWFAAHSLAPAR